MAGSADWLEIREPPEQVRAFVGGNDVIQLLRPHREPFLPARTAKRFSGENALSEPFVPCRPPESPDLIHWFSPDIVTVIIKFCLLQDTGIVSNGAENNYRVAGVGESGSAELWYGL